MCFKLQTKKHEHKIYYNYQVQANWGVIKQEVYRLPMIFIVMVIMVVMRLLVLFKLMEVYMLRETMVHIQVILLLVEILNVHQNIHVIIQI